MILVKLCLIMDHFAILRNYFYSGFLKHNSSLHFHINNELFNLGIEQSKAHKIQQQ